MVNLQKVHSSRLHPAFRKSRCKAGGTSWVPIRFTRVLHIFSRSRARGTPQRHLLHSNSGESKYTIPPWEPRHTLHLSISCASQCFDILPTLSVAKLKCAGAIRAWSSTTLTRFISTSSWHDMQDLNPAGDWRGGMDMDSRTWSLDRENRFGTAR